MVNNIEKTPPPPLLDAHNLSHQFGNTLAVQGIDIQLHRGEVTGFLGLNGAGKTTTLRMLCGTLATKTGHVTIAGQDLHTHPQLARTQLGYLPDTPPLYPELQVDEYLRYCARLHRIPKARLAESIAHTKQQTGLEQHGSHRIARLSRGYRQRVGIAQAIIHQPSVIILDEPTSGLDPRQIDEIRRLITTLSLEAAVLMSTHSIAEVHAICQRMLVLHEGKLVHQAALEQEPLEDLERTFLHLTAGATLC